MTTFSIAAIDELWLRGILAERRLMHGRAEQSGNEIVAVDVRDAALVSAADEAMARLREAMPRDARVRLVARATGEGVEATMTVAVNGVSVVTDAEHAAKDVAPLYDLCDLYDRYVPLPMAWLNGSAAVLLHEAIGHPLELGIPPVHWPEWLHVDCPLASRRESFRDVPLQRMTRLVASQTGAPFELPDERIEVHLLSGGAYDPLTDVVTIGVAVAEVKGRRIAPFTLRATRERIARAIAGASGEPVRYPGVICSREGQQLVVGSFAPILITTELT